MTLKKYWPSLACSGVFSLNSFIRISRDKFAALLSLQSQGKMDFLETSVEYTSTKNIHWANRDFRREYAAN